MIGDEMAAISPSPEPTTTGDETLDDPCPSSFRCCVCLDLLYKPIVLACGHISCFWCVHKAMHGLRTSNCAICRQPYSHFPSICQLLHHLLFKMEPVAYKRRENEVLEEERRLDVFSPQFTDSVTPGKVPSEDESGTPKESERSIGNLKASRSFGREEESVVPENGLMNGMCKQVSVDDVLCGLCEELLFEPVVLNCGHVFCKSCLSGIGNLPLKCPDCQSLHPGGVPNVCLDLDHFLEEQFPCEYVKKKGVQLQRAQSHNEDSSSGVLQEGKNSKPSNCKVDRMCSEEDLRDVHVGVGCDSCGMYPIKGKRYKCKDCTEAIGFDLCEACYDTSSKLPGRFNQQHTPDHKFELDESQMLCRILLRSLPVDPEQDMVEEFIFDHLSDGQDDPDNNNNASE